MLNRLIFPLAVFAYLLIGWGIGVVFLDDGCLNAAALRIFHGDVPYRDFFTLPTPGYHYFLALIFKLFGIQLLWSRIATRVILALLVLGIHRLARTALSSDASLLVSTIALMWIGNFPYFPGTLPPALMFGVWSASYFLENARKPEKRAAFQAGFLCALSVFCRQDIGVCVGASQLFTAGYAAFRGKKITGARTYLAGLATVAVPAAAYFAVLVPWKDLVFNFVTYPLKIYPDYHRLPYPSLLEGLQRAFSSPSFADKALLLSLQIPRLSLWLIFPAIVLALRAKKSATWGTTLFLCGILGLLFFLQARLRPDDWHLFPVIVVAAVLCAWLLSIFFRHSASRIAAIALVALILIGPLANKASAFFLTDLQPFPFERTRGIVFGPPSWSPGVRNYREAVEYVRKNTMPGEPIFVTSARNDRLCMADPLFYFLADRPSGVRLQEMYRGWAIRPEVQQGLVEELESKKVRYVVLRRDLDNVCNEANASSEPGSTILDGYFRENFTAERIFGSEIVLKKKTK